MKRINWLILVLITAISCIAIYYFIINPTLEKIPQKLKYKIVSASSDTKKLKQKLIEAKRYITKNKLNHNYCFLIDMSLPSNKKRMFVFNLRTDSLVTKGLVAHGSCNTSFLKDATFSNTPECGCSALGKYRIGYKYNGQFGEAFKLYGLDSSNSNAFKRFIVLHSYSCVPNEEPKYPICNSLGCPMVSPNFLAELKVYISKKNQPILLWMFN